MLKIVNFLMSLILFIVSCQAELFAATNTLGSAGVYGLSAPGKLFTVSEKFSYPVLKGLRFDPDDPLKMEFLIDSGSGKDVSSEEAKRLISYFLAGLTIPASELWVNLSPYEKERVASANLSLTDLGKDLLKQDYCLKQLVASLTYPESDLGRNYWAYIHNNAGNVKVNSFNKVWIMPDKSVVYEKGDTALVIEASLKTLRDSDYLALSKNNDIAGEKGNKNIDAATVEAFDKFIMPTVHEEVNHGRNFAPLRQIYNSLILSVWFKNKFYDSFYRSYISKGKINGIDLNDKDVKDNIYNLYVEAFKKGVYNYAKNERSSSKILKRTYFSGGIVVDDRAFKNMQVVSNIPTGENFQEGPIKAVTAEMALDGLQPGRIGKVVAAVGKRLSFFGSDITSESMAQAVKQMPYDLIWLKGEQRQQVLGIAAIVAKKSRKIFAGKSPASREWRHIINLSSTDQKDFDRAAMAIVANGFSWDNFFTYSDGVLRGLWCSEGYVDAELSLDSKHVFDITFNGDVISQGQGLQVLEFIAKRVHKDLSGMSAKQLAEVKGFIFDTLCAYFGVSGILKDIPGMGNRERVNILVIKNRRAYEAALVYPEYLARSLKEGFGASRISDNPPLGGVDVTGSSFHLETRGDDLSPRNVENGYNLHFNRLTFQVTSMRDIAEKKSIKLLSTDKW